MRYWNEMAVVVFFFYLYWGNDVLWLKRTSTKKLPNRISYQIWYNGCLKGKFGRGVQICEGGSISASGFGPGSKSAGGPNPLWHRKKQSERLLGLGWHSSTKGSVNQEAADSERFVGYFIVSKIPHHARCLFAYHVIHRKRMPSTKLRQRLCWWLQI